MRKKERKPSGRVGIGVWDEGNDYQPPSYNYLNRLSRSADKLNDNKKCCSFNDECLINDDFVVWDCN